VQISVEGRKQVGSKRADDGWDRAIIYARDEQLAVVVCG
jgi:hypothetical protein